MCTSAAVVEATDTNRVAVRRWRAILLRPFRSRPAPPIRRRRPALGMEGLETREAPSEALGSLGVPIGAGLLWLPPLPAGQGSAPTATGAVAAADDTQQARRKWGWWDEAIDLTPGGRPAARAAAAPGTPATERSAPAAADGSPEDSLAGVGVRPSAVASGSDPAPQVSGVTPAGFDPGVSGGTTGPGGSPATPAAGGATENVATGWPGVTVAAPSASPAPKSAGSAPMTMGSVELAGGEMSALSAATLLHPSYVVDANKGAVLTEAAPNRDFSQWAIDLRAQVEGAAVQSYSWDLSGAPDATSVAGDTTARLQFAWTSFTGPARSQTVALTTTFAGGGTQTQTFAFTVDGTDSPAWSAPPTSAASFPAASTDSTVVGEGSVSVGAVALGLATGAVSASHALPAYNPDIPATTFVYSSAAADARPIVRVRYELPAAAPTVTAQLTFDGVTYAPVVYDTSTQNPGNVLEFALQADATALPTGRYDYSVAVTGPASSGGGGGPGPILVDGGFEAATTTGGGSTTDGSGTVTYSGRTNVVNAASSPFGAGWSLGGLNRLWVVSDGVVIEEAGGRARYRQAPGSGGPGTMSAPPELEDSVVTFAAESGDFNGFAQNPDGSYTETLPNGTKVNYSAAGFQTSIVDRNGNTTAYEYDGAGRLTTITDEHGLGTTFAYDAAGKLASVADPASRTTGFTVSGGRLTTVTDAASKAWAYGYDAAGRLTQATDPTARDTVVTYGAGGRASSATWEDGATESLTPWAVRGLAVAPQGTTTNPAPAALSAAATAVHTDGRGYDWTYRLDWSGFGRTARADAPDGGVGVTFHGADSLPWLAADPLGRRARSFFDAKGNPTTAVHPDDTFATATYSEFAQPLTRTDELGRTTTYAYDADGDLVSVTDPLGHVTTQVVNPDGTVASRTSPLGHTVTFGYDTRDRLVSETNALGHATTFGYDARGNKTAVTDALGLTTTTAYDALNRAVSVTDARGGVTTTVYDAAGRVLTLTDPVGNVTAYAYSTAVDKVAVVTDPQSQMTANTYDAEGHLIAVTDRNGRVREWGHDPVGRPTSELWRNAVGGPAVYTAASTFDLAGQLVSVADPSSAYAFTYDARGRVLTEDNAGTPEAPRVVLTHGYDAAGNLLSVADNLGGTVGYSYSTRGELAGASLIVGGVLGANAAWGYDAAGRQVSVTRREGTGGPTVGTTLGYDAAGRLTSIAHTSSAAGALSSFGYGYDKADRLTSYAGADGSLTYGYDNADQLTSVSGAYPEAFGYDLNGNRNTAGHATETGNRLLSDGAFSYGYDAEGNRTSKTRVSDGQVTTYTYDHRNRLTGAEVRSAGGILLAEERYTFDSQDRRIGVLTDLDGAGPQAATRLWTAYRGDNAWADFDGAGALQTRYLFGLGMDSLVARAGAGGAAGWYLTDNLGSVRQVVATGGAVLYAAGYTAFGQVLSATGAGGDRFGFTGREWSGVTGEGYYRARQYDPVGGRFLSQDPIGFAAGDANLYRYVGNRPASAADPDGLRERPRIFGRDRNGKGPILQFPVPGVEFGGRVLRERTGPFGWTRRWYGPGGGADILPPSVYLYPFKFGLETPNGQHEFQGYPKITPSGPKPGWGYKYKGPQDK